MRINGKITIIPGTRITFKSATRSHNRSATRNVTGFTYARGVRCPTVTKYHGWSNFVVYPHEITHVNGLEVNNER